MIVLAVVAMVASGASSSLIALLLGKLCDTGFYEQSDWIILAAPIGLVLVTGLNGFGMFMSNYLLAKVSQSITNDLRCQLFANMLRWPASAYPKNPSGLISSKFINEANFALTSATKSAVVFVRDSVQTVSLFFVLVWHNWILTIVVFFIGPLVYWLLKGISTRIKKVMLSSQQNIATVLSRVKETYESYSLIKISNAYEAENARFRLLNEEVRKLVLSMTKIASIGTPATQVIGMTGVALVLAAALWQTQHGMLTMGEFVSFLAAMLLMLQPLKRLAGLNSSLVGMCVAADSLFSTLDESLEPDNGIVELARANGAITFDHATLRYPNADRDAVHDFNLTVSPGEHIALVGLSGSGKTSLVNMVPRFWNPTSGRILIDDTDAQEFTLSSLRRQIGFVSQDVILFDGTLKENIAYAMPDATDEAIRIAVQSAALDDFVASLPDGLNTRISDGGGQLSGGQRQRISIARAILKNAPILILDEATSALDSENEKKIVSVLNNLMKDRTVLIVAHRLSSIQNADRIVVMENGIIREIGSHSELLAADGAYAKLVALQELGAVQ